VLRQQLDEGIRLRPGDTAGWSSWLTETRHWVIEAFGERSSNHVAFEMAGNAPRVLSVYASDAEIAQQVHGEYEAKLRQLNAFVSVLEKTVAMSTPASAPRSPTSTERPSSSNRVFVVHGHDEAAKQGVARYLEKLGLEAIILHEQPNKGLTIIEKFEAYSDVPFAVVLLTPDDQGPAGSPPRARQNVILELGYFLGKLGRSRVCALYKDGTDIPSDFQGVLFVLMDPAGAWRLLLAREMKQILPGVDLNKAIDA
jgi:predicted nucleotide-binding protein